MKLSDWMKGEGLTVMTWHLLIGTSAVFTCLTLREQNKVTFRDITSSSHTLTPGTLGTIFSFYFG